MTEQMSDTDDLAKRFEEWVPQFRPRRGQSIGEVDWRTLPAWESADTEPTIEEVFEAINLAQNDYWLLFNSVEGLRPLVDRRAVTPHTARLLEMAKEDQAELVDRYWAVRYQLYPIE